MKKEYRWDAIHGVAICKICDRGREYIAYSYCHPEDEMVKSEITGSTIAEYRAMIKMYKGRKNNIYGPQFKILKHMLVNESNPEFINKIWRQINVINKEINVCNINIEFYENRLKKYIDKKEEAKQKYIEKIDVVADKSI